MKKPPIVQPDKPIMPIVPEYKDYMQEGAFIRAYRQYEKDLKQYKVDMENYEQIKWIRFIKNADLRLCLQKFKIVLKKQ